MNLKQMAALGVIPVEPVARPIVSQYGAPTSNNCFDALDGYVLWLGSQWAVTSYGIEARDGSYSITKDRLVCAGSETQIENLSGMDWLDVEDFATAFFVACGLFGFRLTLAQREQHMRDLEAARGNQLANVRFKRLMQDRANKDSSQTPPT